MNVRPKVKTAKNMNRERLILVSLLLFLLVMLFIFAYYILDLSTSDPASGDHLKANLEVTDTTSESMSPSESVYPVSYAEYTDASVTFSDEFSFTNAILIDLDTNNVLGARAGEEKIYPASLTKIMTLIVAVEHCDDLDDIFTMSDEILRYADEESASVAGFAAGEKVTVRDMLYGLILPSGADAALGLATYVAGSEKEFVNLMNEKCSELGLSNTHFVTCTGLHDEEHYSTCHELALMLEYAMTNDIMYKILSTYQYTTETTGQNPEGIQLTSTMFSRMYGDEPNSVFVVGGKTGYTLEAHHCLASFAVRCNEGEAEESIYSRSPNYILVTVGSNDIWGPIFNAIDIYSMFSSDKNTQ